MAAKAKGANVIALTSMQHTKDVTSRHSSGKKICDIADVTIDNCAVMGDANFYVEGVNLPVGPTSDATGIAIAQALSCEIVEKFAAAGAEPPIFVSSNVDGGDEKNAWLYKKYYGYWK
jgi:uncharacterized phosphosugar-binding protein